MDEALLSNLKAALRANRSELAGMEDGRDEPVAFDEDTQIRYQNVFLNHPDGWFVLKDLGKRMNFGGMIKDMRFAIAHNIFVEILTICGMDQDEILSFVSKERS